MDLIKKKKMKLREFKNHHEYQKFVLAHYSPLFPHLYTLKETIFVPSFQKAIHTKTKEAFLDILEEIHPGIYSFSLLRPCFCEQLLEEMAWFEKWCLKNHLHKQIPNTMNNYGVVLDDFGWWPFFQKFMENYIAPLASFLYPEVGGDSLDQHHCFIVEYALEKDLALDFHVDASEVTLNVCLGKEFSGGKLYFGGIRCAIHQQTSPLPDEEFYLEHQLGKAILHQGKHRHLATEINKGERFNLILWCKSQKFQKNYKKQECPTWCGYHKS